MSFSPQMGKKPKGYEVFSTLNPQQQASLQQILSSIYQQGGAAGDITQNRGYQLGSQFNQDILGGDTSKFEAPLMREFNEKIIPGLAERFSGAGAGAQSSSAFQNALSSSGADLAERLGALRGGLQGQAADRALGYAQQPVTNVQNLLGMNTQAFAPKQMGFGKQALVGLSGGVGQGLGMGLTGGFGGAAAGGSGFLKSILKLLGIGE